VTVDDDAHLLDLASSIDEDRPVDWDKAEGDSSESERAVVSELRVLAAMSLVSRNPEAATMTPLGQWPGPLEASGPQVTWGPFTIIEVIGAGAFGTVYRARDNLNRDIALKLFNDPAQAARVLQEGRLLARVRHPNIVVVHGCNEFNGRVGLWMELIRGRTLEEELRGRGSLSAQEAKLIGLDLCRALAAVHEAGLVHRDVKAQNVMRENGGRIVLMDFGAGSDTHRVDQGAWDIVGTPVYLAPEVFAGQSASKTSDIYSLGVLLYHLVTGRYPVAGSNRIEIQRAHGEGHYMRLRDARPDLPEGFVQVVESAIDPDPQHRYQTAGEFEYALAASCGSLSDVPVARPSPSGPTLLRPLMIAALAVAAIVILWVIGPPHSRGGDAVTAPPDIRSSSASGTPATPASGAEADYTIAVGFYKVTTTDEVRLAAGDAVAPGDALILKLEASTAVFVYVINEDDHGEAYLLFPLQDEDAARPLAAGVIHELPGPRVNQSLHWQVTSAGGREHFVVFVSPAHMALFDGLLRSLPRPAAGTPVSKPRIPSAMVSRLRGVGGLVETKPTGEASGAHNLFQSAGPLGLQKETTRGLWVRQLTLENPVR
jgi:eukaryotic-like serine/threonine-protein kinase